MYRKKNPAIITLNADTAYLAGVIVGDGHLSASYKSHNSRFKDYRLNIDISDREYLHKIFDIIKTIVPTRTSLTIPTQRGNRIPRLNMALRNKELFLFFTETLGIPAGKKSSIIRVPEIILNYDTELQKHFLAGYFDTDGGFRGRTLGFTTASYNMQTDVSKLLNELHISHSLEKWFNKKYSKTYYGIRLKKKEIDNFLNILPLRNLEKKERIIKRFQCGNTKVAKWDRYSIDNME